MIFGNEAKIRDEKSTHRLLNLEVIAFLDRLHNQFDGKRRELLQKREAVAVHSPVFKAVQPPIVPIPKNIKTHGVEVTAPANKHMMINALYANATMFAADFTNDKVSQWEVSMSWQQNLYDVIRKQNGFYAAKKAKTDIAVKPRTWDMAEENLTKEGRPMSASLVDFGIYLYHNAKELLKQNRHPHFYLSNIQNHLEARLWNDIFIYAQNDLQIPQGSIQATLINEEITDEEQVSNILYELADHSTELYYTI